MLSVADIPIAGIHFTGIIGNILWEGKEYRLATYLGARLVHLKKQKASDSSEGSGIGCLSPRGRSSSTESSDKRRNDKDNS